MKDPSVVQLLMPLNGNCFTKHEGWWSYEFCMGKHVRQYHADHVQQADGRKKTVVQAEYFLGMAGGPSSKKEQKKSGGDPASRKKATGKSAGGELIAVAEDPSMSRFIVEFKNGTLCDESNSRREITIEMKCGVADAFQSVQEDRTCHYTLLFATPRLCSHPDFKQKAKARQKVKVVPARGEGLGL
jgi:hypothetical protein